MSMNGTKPGRVSGWMLRVAFALACGLPVAARADWGDNDYWKSGSAN